MASLNGYREEENQRIFDFVDKYNFKDKKISRFITDMGDWIPIVIRDTDVEIQKAFKFFNRDKENLCIAKDSFIYFLDKDQNALADAIRKSGSWSGNSQVCEMMKEYILNTDTKKYLAEKQKEKEEEDKLKSPEQLEKEEAIRLDNELEAKRIELNALRLTYETNRVEAGFRVSHREAVDVAKRLVTLPTECPVCGSKNWIEVDLNLSTDHRMVIGDAGWLIADAICSAFEKKDYNISSTHFCKDCQFKHTYNI